MSLRTILIFLIAAASALLSVHPTARPVRAADFTFGYLQGGDYPPYQELFGAIVMQLQERGWLDRVEFAPDACFSADWDKEKCREMAEALAARKDLDMIWAMGTWAGQALVRTPGLTTPVCVMSVSNAVESGIVPNYNDSGRDNLTTRVDPTKHERQIRLFHQLFGFRRLGFVYANTPSGRTYADWKTLKRLSRELGFKLISYNKIPENETEAPEAILEGVRELAPQIDAFYLTVCIGFDYRQAPAVLEVLNNHKIPTMAMDGSDYVKAGALVTIADSMYVKRAAFTTDKIIKILKGTSPRNLPMVFEPEPRLALNLAVAEKIGWEPPAWVMNLTDEAYDRIMTPLEIEAGKKTLFSDFRTVVDFCPLTKMIK